MSVPDNEAIARFDEALTMLVAGRDDLEAAVVADRLARGFLRWAAASEAQAIAVREALGNPANALVDLVGFMRQNGMIEHDNSAEEIVGRYLLWVQEGSPAVRRPR